MSRQEKIQEIIEYLEENENTFIECIEVLDDYNGYLGDDRIYSMDDLTEILYGLGVMDILNRAYFGRDADNWDWVGDTKVYHSFNPNRYYFWFDGYANLVSSNYKDYSGFLDEHVVLEFLTYKDELNMVVSDWELSGLIELLEELEEMGE